MVRRIGSALLWPLALAFLFVGFNKNDPYLISLRGTGNVAVVAIGVAIAAMLVWRGYWSSRAKKILVLLWCLAPLSVLAAHARFELRKHDVLRTDVSTAHKLGRHFMVGYSSFNEVAELAERGLIAGVYVTRHNLRSRGAEALKSEISALQARRRGANLPPLIVAADQEGGIVSHLAPVLTELPGLSTLADLPADLRDRMAEEYGRIHGRELTSLGINLNFAPVLDLRPEKKITRFDFNTLIGRRAISGDPAKVADVALPYIHGLETSGVGATVKHFPGLGRVRGDTHHFSVDLETPLDELEASDWRPFRQALAGSRAMLMVGHVRLTAADPDRAASHSKKVIDGIIRGKWNYRGVVITDDLVMGAIYQHDVCTAVVEALNAGVDLLLVAFDGKQFYRIFACASAAAGQARLDPAMLDASEARLNRHCLGDERQVVVNGAE
ncbi:MAG: glycoside hydrolase family 3 protein [Bradyrhizobium sp.]|nr:glycoside hydrolase family 3 protein [Bradyrhizobium sp.]